MDRSESNKQSPKEYKLSYTPQHESVSNDEGMKKKNKTKEIVNISLSRNGYSGQSGHELERYRIGMAVKTDNEHSANVIINYLEYEIYGEGIHFEDLSNDYNYYFLIYLRGATDLEDVFSHAFNGAELRNSFSGSIIDKMDFIQQARHLIP